MNNASLSIPLNMNLDEDTRLDYMIELAHLTDISIDKLVPITINMTSEQLRRHVEKAKKGDCFELLIALLRPDQLDCILATLARAVACNDPDNSLLILSEIRQCR